MSVRFTNPDAVNVYNRAFDPSFVDPNLERVKNRVAAFYRQGPREIFGREIDQSIQRDISSDAPLSRGQKARIFQAYAFVVERMNYIIPTIASSLHAPAHSPASHHATPPRTSFQPHHAHASSGADGHEDDNPGLRAADEAYEVVDDEDDVPAPASHDASAVQDPGPASAEIIADLRNASDELVAGPAYAGVHGLMQGIFRDDQNTPAFKKMKAQFTPTFGTNEFLLIEAGLRRRPDSALLDAATKKLICKAYAAFLEFERAEQIEKVKKERKDMVANLKTMQEDASFNDAQITIMRDALYDQLHAGRQGSSAAFLKMKGCIGSMWGWRDQFQPLMRLLNTRVDGNYLIDPRVLSEEDKKLICRAYRLYLREKTAIDALDQADALCVQNIDRARTRGTRSLREAPVEESPDLDFLEDYMGDIVRASRQRPSDSHHEERSVAARSNPRTGASSRTSSRRSTEAPRLQGQRRASSHRAASTTSASRSRGTRAMIPPSVTSARAPSLAARPRVSRTAALPRSVATPSRSHFVRQPSHQRAPLARSTHAATSQRGGVSRPRVEGSAHSTRSRAAQPRPTSPTRRSSGASHFSYLDHQPARETRRGATRGRSGGHFSYLD